MSEKEAAKIASAFDWMPKLTDEELAQIEAEEKAQREKDEAAAAEERRLRKLRVSSFPARYREEWCRPDDKPWADLHSKISKKITVEGSENMGTWERSLIRPRISGGITALVGGRGTGKTRMAAEVCREFASSDPTYTTAMELFLRIRSTYDRDSKESEKSVIEDLADASILVIDEVQERGNSEWEDRLLTHIIDRRYGNERPTILIANLTKKELAGSLGASIVSRLQETGGVIEMTGPSHRTKK
jgi:DNA replication protein DnaC